MCILCPISGSFREWHSYRKLTRKESGWRKNLHLSVATFRTDLLVLFILLCQQPLPRDVYRFALIVHSFMPSSQQRRGLMNTLRLVWSKRIRSLKVKYHDFYAAVQPDRRVLHPTAYYTEWSWMYSYSFGHKTLFLRPKQWLWSIILCSPTIHHAACLDELEMWLHFMCSVSLQYISLTEASLILSFARDISGPFSVSLLAHIKRLIQCGLSYLCFEGGSFTKNDRLVTCNQISPGYTAPICHVLFRPLEISGQCWCRRVRCTQSYLRLCNGYRVDVSILALFRAGSRHVQQLHPHASWTLQTDRWWLWHVEILPMSTYRHHLCLDFTLSSRILQFDGITYVNFSVSLCL